MRAAHLIIASRREGILYALLLTLPTDSPWTMVSATGSTYSMPPLVTESVWHDVALVVWGTGEQVFSRALEMDLYRAVPVRVPTGTGQLPACTVACAALI